MKKKGLKTLVIGLGETGWPLFELLKGADQYNVDGWDTDFRKGQAKPIAGSVYDILHICIPEIENFVGIVRDYITEYNPRAVVIHTTVHPGMTDHIANYYYHGEKVEFFYSPINGNITDGMKWGLTTYTKRIARSQNTLILESEGLTEKILEQFSSAGMNPLLEHSVVSLEYAKNFDLAYYGTCIAVFQEIERIVEKENLDYELIKNFIFSIPTEAKKGGKTVERAKYYGGFIGGHCVIPAIERITSMHSAPLFTAVIYSNIKRAKEKVFK